MGAILEKEEECKRIATELEQSKIEIETFKKLQMNGLQAQNMSNYMIDSTKKQQKKMQLKTQKHGKFEANDQTEDNMQQSMKGLNAQSAVNYNVPQSYQQQQISYQQRFMQQIVDSLSTSEREKLNAMSREDQQRWFATTIQQQQQRQFNQQQNRAQNVMNAQQQQSNNVNSNSQQSKQSNVNKKEFDLQQNNQMKQYDANSVSTTSASTQNNTQQQQPRIVHGLTSQQIMTLQQQGYTISQNPRTPNQWVIVPPALNSMQSMQINQAAASQNGQQPKQAQIPHAFGVSNQQQLSAQNQSAFGNQAMFIQPQYQTMFIQPQYIQQQQPKSTNAPNGSY